MDNSCEPMDVDLSSNSANTSFHKETIHGTLHGLHDRKVDKSTVLETNHLIKPETWNVKKYHIVRNNMKSNSNNTKIIICSICIVSIAVVGYCITNIKCINNLNFNELKLKLIKRVYGQPAAIDSLIKALDMNANSKVLILYGGTGVGKTLTVSLLLENVWDASNIYHFTMPSFTNIFSTEAMLGLHLCDYSIIVVDDIQQNDFIVKEKIKEVLTKSESINRKLTVILIYNCDVISKEFVKKCNDSFYLNLVQTYEDVMVYKKFIHFKPLTQEVLKMCIDNELSGRIVNNVDLNNMYNNFDVSLDGCKGVSKKIKFWNIL